MNSYHHLHPPSAPPDHCFLDLNKTLSTFFVVVFCTAFAYLILKSILHCVRRQRRFLRDRDVVRRAAALDPDCTAQLRAIPAVAFGDLAPPSPPAPSCSPPASGGRGEPESCPVCLEEYERGEEVRVLPRCGHVFHRACSDLWLLTRSSFCPICRDRVIEREVEPASARCALHEGHGGGSDDAVRRSEVLDMGIRTNMALL